jgi:hypothetical protein
MFKWIKKSEKKKEALRQREISICAEYSAWNQHQIEYETKRRERLLVANRAIKKHLRRGDSSDYFQFLDAYIEAGGKPSHHYDYDCGNDIYVATNVCKIFPLYGADSIMVIMMPGCRIIEGDYRSRPLQGWNGHNNFYSYDNILNQKYATWVPTYSDWN